MKTKVPKGIEIRGNHMRMSFMHDRALCRETLKLDITPANLKYAERWRSTILHEIATGTFVYHKHFPNSKTAQRAKPGAAVTVAQALRTWLETNKAEWRYSSWLDFTNMAENVLIPKWGEWTMADFSKATAEVKEWRNALSCGPKRANNLLIPLRAICDEAFYNDQIERNPMARVKNLENVSREADPFEPEEVDAILATIEDESGRNLLRFAFSTGLRTGELIGFSWPAVDWRRTTARIDRSVVRGREEEGAKTKAGVRDLILLSGALASIQAQRPHTQLMGGRVFHNTRTGRPWRTPAEIQKVLWKPALERAGVRYRNLYQTRHTFASTALMGGFAELQGMEPMALVMWLTRQMGHTDPSMIFKVYGKYLTTFAPKSADKGASMG